MKSIKAAAASSCWTNSRSGRIGRRRRGCAFRRQLVSVGKAKAAGAPIEIDVSKIESGQMLTAEWQGKPIWVVNRTDQQLKDLKGLSGVLTDPNSEVNHQPEDCKNETRSIKPNVLVAIGICTHLGCSPTYRPDIAPADLGAEWKGGFFCPCHGSKFDIAGRVYAGAPAPTNLVVPPHKYLSDTTIQVGDENIKRDLNYGKPNQ